MMPRVCLVLYVSCMRLLCALARDSDKYPWTYDDRFGGATWWGMLPGRWTICKDGKLQSPVNVDPQFLLYDPHLPQLHFDKVDVDAVLENTGQLPVVRLLEPKPTAEAVGSLYSNALGAPPSQPGQLQRGLPMVSFGPLGQYKYKVTEMVLHLGNSSARIGSDHAVAGERFAGELQIMAYSELAASYEDALQRPHGVVAIAVMVDNGASTHSEMRKLTELAGDIVLKGASTPVFQLNPYFLLPDTAHYVTYEGSLTYPGCHESVTWIIMNKPILISSSHYKVWNELQRTETPSEPPEYMMQNTRPLQPLNGRLLRTNINFKTKGTNCIYKDMYYRKNPLRTSNPYADANRLSKRHSESPSLDTRKQEHILDEV